MNEPRAHWGQKRNAEEHRHQLCSDAIWIRLSKFSTQSFWSKRSIHVNAEFVLLAHLSSEARSSPLAPSDIASALVNMKAADSNCRFSDHPCEPWSFCGVVGAREFRLRFPREGWRVD